MRITQTKKPAKVRHIALRMDQITYDLISGEAIVANLSVSEYIRRCVRNRKIVIRDERVVNVPELKQMLAELGHLGANMNQIAHYYNSGGPITQEMHTRLQRAVADLYDLKYKLEKLGGTFDSGHP